MCNFKKHLHINTEMKISHVILSTIRYLGTFTNQHNIILHWVVPKKIHTSPTEEIFAVWGGGEGNCLKNVLNFYRMSGEGEGGIVNFLRGGMDLF